MTFFIQIFIGISLLCFGLYGILVHWWTIVDLAGVIIPLSLVIFGILALLAGISTVREKQH